MKNTHVVWTDESIGDLEAIFDFLAAHSPKSAQKIVESILFRTRQLEAFPESGSPEETLKSINKKYRYLVEGHYKIIYWQDESVLYVEAVVDTRRDMG